MSLEADIADLQSSDVGTSSLRTQLIEAQILDFQLEGEDQEVELFLTSDFSLQLDDCNVSLLSFLIKWSKSKF